MGRKRQYSDLSFQSNDSEDSENVPAKRTYRTNEIWDPYCWICHQYVTDRHCSTCIRSYHSQCIALKDNASNEQSFQCDLCIRMVMATKDYIKREVNLEDVHKMLGYVTNRLSNDIGFSRLGTVFSGLRTPAVAGPDIVNPFDLSIVIEKIDTYETLLEFISDIRWIRHNAEIVLNEEDDRLQIARNMEELCEKEIYDIEMCSECFERANTNENWFTEVCNPPHIPVWARMKGHPYWPAKVIGLSTVGNDKIDVRFFGKHEMWIVSVTDCILYSDDPNKKLDDQVRSEIDAGIKEADVYMRNLGKKFDCDLVIAEPKTHLYVQKIGTQLKAMIPSLNLPPNYKLNKKPAYLKKNRRRKVNNSPVQQLHLVELSVRLTRCDAILTEQQKLTLKDTSNEQTVEEPIRSSLEATSNEQSEGERYRAHIEFTKRQDLIINLRKSNGFDGRCYVISSDESEAETEPVPEAEIVLDLDSPAKLSNRHCSLSSCTTAKDTEDETENNDSELSLFRKDPPKRTYGSLENKQKTGGSKAPSKLPRKSTSLSKSTTRSTRKSQTESPYYRKAYRSLHSNVFATRRKIESNKTSDSAMEIDDVESSADPDGSQNDSGSSNIQSIVTDLNKFGRDDGNDIALATLKPIIDDETQAEPQSQLNETEGETDPQVDETQTQSEEQVNENEFNKEISEGSSDSIANDQMNSYEKSSKNEKEPEQNPLIANENVQHNLEEMVSENQTANVLDENIGAILDENIEQMSEGGPTIIIQEANNDAPTENAALQVNSMQSTLPGAMIGQEMSGIACESIDSSEHDAMVVEADAVGTKEVDAVGTVSIIRPLEIIPSSVTETVWLLEQDNKNQTNKVQLLEEELKINKEKIQRKDVTQQKSTALIEELKTQIDDLKETLKQTIKVKDDEIHAMKMEIFELKENLDKQTRVFFNAAQEPDMSLKSLDESAAHKEYCTLCRMEVDDVISKSFQVLVCSMKCLRELWSKERAAREPINEDDPVLHNDNGNTLQANSIESTMNGDQKPSNTSSLEQFSEIDEY